MQLSSLTKGGVKTLMDEAVMNEEKNKVKKIFTSKDEIEKHIIANKGGLEFEFFVSNGSVRRLGLKDVMVNLYMGHPLQGSISNIYLRVIDGEKVRYTSLTGPESPSTFAFGKNSVIWKGTVSGISYEVIFTLSQKTDMWFYVVKLSNESGSKTACDVVYLQDKGISHEANTRVNENYVSQYIDQKIFNTPKYGYVIAGRKNHPYKSHCAWILEGCMDGNESCLTDGLQFFGLSYKETNNPEALLLKEWKSEVIQDEFSITAFKSKKYVLEPGQKQELRYFGYVKEDHKEATSEKDLAVLDGVEDVYNEAIAQVSSDAGQFKNTDKNVFNNVRFFKTLKLEDNDLDKYFGGEKKHTEYSGDKLFSFFTDSTHVVLKDKDLSLVRTHGNIIRSGTSLCENDRVLALTNYIYGGFNLHLSVGNTSFDQLLSHHRGQFNIQKASGQRVFVMGDKGYEMLGMPSAYQMGLTFGRWIYKEKDRVIEVKVWTDPEEPRAYLEVGVLEGEPAEFLITSEIGLGGTEFDDRGRFELSEDGSAVNVYAQTGSFLARKRPDCKYFISCEKDKIEKLGFDELIFEAGHSYDLPYVAVKTKKTDRVRLVTGGSVLSAKDADDVYNASDLGGRSFEADIGISYSFWKDFLMNAHIDLPEGTERDKELISKINELLLWYLHNAGIHFTVPFGLEQYKGGAWGTRDVLQGPVEAYLPLRRYDVVRDLLLKVFSAQFIETGSWPQWFMLGVYNDVQLPESHGDIIAWPFKAVSEYINASNDFSILDEKVPYTHHDDPKKAFTKETETVCEHLFRAIDYIKANFVPGTYLSSYAGGDWDDTLRPANNDLRERMVSGWTVSITYQYLKAFAEILDKVGKKNEARDLEELVNNIRNDYYKLVIKDEVASGFIYIGRDGKIDYMLHPKDDRTHIKYRLLPMIRGIIGELFTPEEASYHYDIIKKHLDCPDGARLMDSAVPYSGGPIKWFRRAEMGANFGREIGLMYVHAHIRYLEALSRVGKADELFDGAQKVIPINIADSVKNAETRQANTYFSSSDGDFKTRYEVDFGKLREGKIKVKGGWRIYSSGPGLFINQILSNFLGIRYTFGNLVIDPVIPARLDGLTYRFDYKKGVTVKCIYCTGGKNSIGVSEATLNGEKLASEPVSNPYRKAGVKIPLSVFEGKLREGENELKIILSS
ncbi:GH36-type glycosyl hydrolase domain-containing protein [Candidatus Auribacterota bacterium]